MYLTNYQSHSMRVEGEQNILNAELQAIEWILVNTPKEWRLKIVTDSKNSISNIKNFSSAPYSKRMKLKSLATLRQINKLIMKKIKKEGSISFQHVYSHPEEKIKNAKLISKEKENKWI